MADAGFPRPIQGEPLPGVQTSLKPAGRGPAPPCASRNTEKAKLSSNFDVTILSMVEHNLGVTIMPKLIFEGKHGGRRRDTLDPPLKAGPWYGDALRQSGVPGDAAHDRLRQGRSGDLDFPGIQPMIRRAAPARIA